MKDLAHLFDGILVMLVRPGTTDKADLAMQGRLKNCRVPPSSVSMVALPPRTLPCGWARSLDVVAGRALVGGTGPAC